MFSIRFDDGLGWGSVSGTLGEEEEEVFPIRKGWLKHARSPQHQVALILEK